MVGAADAFSSRLIEVFLESVEDLRKIIVPDAKESGNEVLPEPPKD